MADLSRPRRDDRGQIILLIGFTLAVTFVALAVILNAAIYAENLATRSDTGIDGSSVEVRGDIQSATGALLEYVNTHNNTDAGAVETNATRAIADYRGVAGRQAALDGRLLSLSIESLTNGSRLVQTDEGRNLTSAGGTANWTLATGVQARSVTLNVSDNRTTTGACSPSGACFRVNATDGTDTWRMAVYENATDVVVEIETASGTTATCSPSPDGSDRARIDLAAGTVDGQDCTALRRGLPGPPYDVGIVNGDLAEGTYEVITDDDSIANSPAPRYHGPGSSASPRATHAIYAADLRIEQRSDRVVYNGTLRVAPGEWP